MPGNWSGFFFTTSNDFLQHEMQKFFATRTEFQNSRAGTANSILSMLTEEELQNTSVPCAAAQQPSVRTAGTRRRRQNRSESKSGTSRFLVLLRSGSTASICRAASRTGIVVRRLSVSYWWADVGSLLVFGVSGSFGFLMARQGSPR